MKSIKISILTLLFTSLFACAISMRAQTVIRSPTERERIEFRWHDLCRQQRANLQNCLALKEQAKREILGNRYVAPRKLGPALTLTNFILGVISDLDPPQNTNPVPKNPPYIQRPRRY